MRDESHSHAPSLATKYGICFQEVTGVGDENHLVETLSQFDTVSGPLDALNQLKPWVSEAAGPVPEQDP
jgi:hypothetical protein